MYPSSAGQLTGGRTWTLCRAVRVPRTHLISISILCGLQQASPLPSCSCWGTSCQTRYLGVFCLWSASSTTTGSVPGSCGHLHSGRALLSPSVWLRYSLSASPREILGLVGRISSPSLSPPPCSSSAGSSHSSCSLPRPVRSLLSIFWEFSTRIQCTLSWLH